MNFSDIASRLAAARATARPAEFTSLDVVASVKDAYAIQSELIRLAGDGVRGWKVTALTAQDQRKYASSRPVAGALLGPHVHHAPASLHLSAMITPLLECEVAFVLAADLPPHASGYDQMQIEAAIRAVVPVFELADSRVPAGAPDLLKLADAMGNGSFIVGRPIENWRSIDLANIPITLTRNGVEIERGSSARILGNPLLAVLALANAQPLPGNGLKAGQVITTGTCTTPIKVGEGKFVATFGPLGDVEMTLSA